MKKLAVLCLVLISVSFVAWSCGNSSTTPSSPSNPTATSVPLTSTPTGPTGTFTNTATTTFTNTVTKTATSTQTYTITNTLVNTATNTSTLTITNTPTATNTSTVTSTLTNSPSNTITQTPSFTPTATLTSTITNTPGITPSWKVVGSAAFSVPANYTQLIFNGGNPYVVFADANNGEKGMVEEYTGGAWTVVDGADFTPGAAGYISPAFYNNNLYVAYADGTKAGFVTVEEYTGGAWVTIGSPGFGAAAGDTNLAIDSNGNIYVAFQGVNYSYLMEYSTINGWVTVGGGTYSTGGAIFDSVAFDSSNNPYVAFGDSYYGSATLAEYVSSAWTNVGGLSGVEGANGLHTANYTSLVFNGGNPYVAYMDFDDNELPNLRKWNGTSWSTVGTEGFGTTAQAFYTTVAFSPTNNNPYVSFSDQTHTTSEAMVMEYTGAGTTGWVTVGSGYFSAYSTSFNTLAFDASGDPYVAYSDGNSSNKVTVMEYH